MISEPVGATIAIDPADLRQVRERDHFDALAERTGEIWWGSTTPAGLRRLQRRAEILAERLAALDHPRVLEVGCGTGALTVPLLARLPELNLTACDISPRAVEITARKCRRYASATAQTADLLTAPFERGSFDAVIGNSILHHLPLPRFLPRLWDVLIPGGIIAFFEPNLLNPQVAAEKKIPLIGRWLQNTPDETAFIRWRLKRTLEAAGFVEVTVRPFDFVHPAVPAPFVGQVETLGRWCERLPLIREISGSLIIDGRRGR